MCMEINWNLFINTILRATRNRRIKEKKSIENPWKYWLYMYLIKQGLSILPCTWLLTNCCLWNSPTLILVSMLVIIMKYLNYLTYKKKVFIWVNVLEVLIQDQMDSLIWASGGCAKWQQLWKCGKENCSIHGLETKEEGWPRSHSPL